MIAKIFTVFISNPLYLLIAAATIFAAGSGTGWTANGWRLNAEIAHLKAAASDTRAAQSQAALDKFVAASRVIQLQADQGQLDLSAINHQLVVIQKDFKNAKAPPLPPDCRPGHERVRKLTATAIAVDHAITGQEPGSRLQAEWPASD